MVLKHFVPSVAWVKYAILSMFLTMWIAASAQGPSPNENTEDKVKSSFEALDILYDNGELTDDEYFASIDTLFWSNIKKGSFFKTSQLYNYLSLYKDIAWSSKQHDKVKTSYYYYFVNNAELQGLGGEAMFFADKLSQFVMESKGKPSLSVPFSKCSFYLKNKNYEKARDAYYEVQPLLHEMTGDNITHLERMEVFWAMNLATIMMGSFTELKDSAGLAGLINFAEDLAGGVSGQNNFSSEDSMLIQTMLAAMKYGEFFFFKDYPNALKTLHFIKTNFLDSTKSKDLHIKYSQYHLARSYSEYYLELENTDSAAHYIAIFEGMPPLFNDFQFVLNELKLKLASLNGNYKEAFELSKSALEHIEVMQSTLMNEIDDLLYSHAQAEYNKNELTKSREKQRKRVYMNIVFSIMAIGMLVSGVLLRQRDKKSTRIKLDRINFETKVQVAELTGKSKQAMENAKYQLGMDLHDDLAASVGGVMFHIERLTLGTKDEVMHSELKSLHGQMATVYHTIRDKSHDLFSAKKMSPDHTFTKQINEILHTAFPNKIYTKEVEIDDELVSELSFSMRVEILHILREASANILKHAKASHITLFLYKLDNYGIFFIGDNGVGFNIDRYQNKRSVGLNSLKERSNNLEGTFEINSSKQGTMIEVKFKL